MVDSIKARGTSPQPDQNLGNAKASANSKQTSESLKESFKSISSNLSVAESVKPTTKDSASKTRSRAPSLGGKLEDAVKFSKEALKVLEDITAGGLKGANVQGLLQDSSEPRTVPQYPRPESFEPIRELAEDLSALRADLKNLFESLKQSSDKKEVLNENFQAAEVNASDLEVAMEKAKKTSLRIQFNANDALEAHSGLTFGSVAQLLDPDLSR